MSARGELWLIRHGETEWTLSGAHTSRTDLPLTDHGRRCAEALRHFLEGRQFALVLSSPMRRAIETARLAGFTPEITADLCEWDYGRYEGLTTPETQKDAPDWTIWTGATPGGETIEQVSARAERVIELASSAEGDVAVFGHGHMLRLLGARWLGLKPQDGRLFALSTSSVSVLGYERETRVFKSWNQTVG
ncbi:MAG: histidine phosphatase family protein [Bryobacteraceae bacterium]